MKKLLVPTFLLVLTFAVPLRAAEVTTDNGPVTSTNLSVQECQNLGCTFVDAPSCPLIMHDYAMRRWACKCPSGSSCLDQNSPH